MNFSTSQPNPSLSDKENLRNLRKELQILKTVVNTELTKRIPGTENTEQETPKVDEEEED